VTAFFRESYLGGVFTFSEYISGANLYALVAVYAGFLKYWGHL
jgi:hypothetical protein